MGKINWKFYKPYRDILIDKKDEFLSKLLDKEKKKIDLNSFYIKKLLFLRIDGKIGDYIVSSFVFREIKKKYPHIVIEVLAHKSLEELLKLNKNIDKYYIFDRKKTKEWIKIAKKLKNENYDVIFDSTEGLKYKQIYLLNKLNAKINVGYNKDNYKIYNEKVIHSTTIKMKEIYKKMLEKINIFVDNTDIEVSISEESEKKIEQFFYENNLVEEKIIALNFYGASSGRKINEENALIIIRKLQEKYKNYKIILLDSPSDRDKIYKILEKAKKDVLFFEKSSTILDSISIIKRSNIVVSVDTSILHIAEGLNKKVIAFYGPKLNKNKWRIKEEGNILIDYTVNQINKVDFEKLNY